MWLWLVTQTAAILGSDMQLLPYQFLSLQALHLPSRNHQLLQRKKMMCVCVCVCHTIQDRVTGLTCLSPYYGNTFN